MPPINLLRVMRLFLFAGILVFCTNSVLALQKIQGDSITVAVAPEYDSVGNVHRFLFGDNNRKLWATPVKIKVFHIGKEKGGLKILQLGGGMQTKSLRLEDATGQQWVLRTIQKYPEKTLPIALRGRKSLARDILQDEVSSAHPFSALAVPPLAQALDIPHSNPQIVYVADDEELGKYREQFANQVFLFEEREPLDAEKTYNTGKAQEKLREDNDNRVDQKLVLRARLLDMLLGDWDRHEDQWRWQKYDLKKGNLYKPIPRDRDQVFYKTSGVFPWIISHQWLKAKFQGYDHQIRDVNSWMVQGMFFDRYFLNSLSEDDWKTEIAYVQKALTDSLIRAAVLRMPASVYAVSGDDIVSKMISRRNVLMQQGLEFYHFIAKVVEVPATDKNDHFAITNNDNGSIGLTIRKIKKDGTLDQVTYQRTFDSQVTKEVRMYGFDGKDVFAIDGTKPSPINVRLIAGDGRDSISIDKELHNKRHIFIYDRKEKKNDLPPSSQARLRLSTDTAVNNYDYKSFKYDRFTPIILGNYSPDVGVSVIGGFSFEKHGFRQEPYAYRHEFLVNYSTARKSFLITYEGDFKKLMGSDYNLKINLRSRGPSNVINFFGIGNQSEFRREFDEEDGELDDDRDIKYYRNKYDLLTTDVSVYRDYGHWRMSAGVAGQFYTANRDDNEGKFLDVYASQNQREDVYRDKLYAGLTTNATFDNRNRTLMATKGIYWTTTLSGYTGVAGAHNKYLHLASEFGFSINPGQDSVFFISNKTGGAAIFGSAGYFQKVKLGGVQNLRGFHTNRFTGENMLYNNIEMRLKVLTFNSYLLPGTVGLIGFNDIGRVWTPGESSNKIHLGYGGGIYIIPANLLIIEAAVGFSREGTMPYISIGTHL